MEEEEYIRGTKREGGPQAERLPGMRLVEVSFGNGAGKESMDLPF